MENSLVNALSDTEFKRVNKKILKYVGDVLGNSVDVISSAFITNIIGLPIPVNYYSLLLKPFFEGYATFRDYMELEKVAVFYDRVNELPDHIRKAFADELNRDNDLDFTKNLIYAVSLLRNKNKAIIAANLFIALAQHIISKDEFESLLNIIDKIDYHDLIFFREKLDEQCKDEIFQLNKQDSKNRINMLNHDFKFMENFLLKKDIYLSNGLLSETINIQKVPKIRGNYIEDENITKLRERLTATTIIYGISIRGSLLYRYGLINF